MIDWYVPTSREEPECKSGNTANLGHTINSRKDLLEDHIRDEDQEEGHYNMYQLNTIFSLLYVMYTG